MINEKRHPPILEADSSLWITDKNTTSEPVPLILNEQVRMNKSIVDKVTGDLLTAGNVDGQSVIAQGRGAQAKLNVFNVDIRLLPLVIGLVGTVAILAFFLFKPEDKPEMMASSFNVAVAEFIVVDEKGNQIKSDYGLDFSNWLYDRFDENLHDELGQLVGSHEIWPPEYTGQISGSTEERTKKVEALAEKINAHIIVYGVINQSGDSNGSGNVELEFYINRKGFDEALEITGHHLFSNAPISLPFDQSDNETQNPGLDARTQGLSLVISGLSYYATDNMTKAIERFEAAEAVPHWRAFKGNGKEVLYLLLGNAYSRRASIENDSTFLDQSESYYDKSLEINNNYARAIVGRAGTFYLYALGDPNNQTYDDLDHELLSKAEAEFTHALTLNSPESANIESKVNFSLGQIYFTRFATGDNSDNWMQRAKNAFQAVVYDFENNNNQAIDDLAAHAYARLGIISLYEGQLEDTFRYMGLAVEYASPFYEAEYQILMGDFYALEAVCEIENASRAYERAITMLNNSVSYGGDALVEKVNHGIERLNSLDCTK